MLPLAYLAAELATDTLLRHAQREALAASMEAAPPTGAAEIKGGPTPSVTPPTASEDAAELALERARIEWGSQIEEPPGHWWQRIDEYIRGPYGLAWPSACLAGRKDTVNYTRNGQFSWCGAFIAFCYGQLHPEIRKRKMASTYRLREWARGTSRMRPPKDAQPGDVGVVGTENDRTGKHIILCASGVQTVEGAELVHSVEGNARGPGPNGQIIEGVIKRTRPLAAQDGRVYRLLYVVRFADEDLLQGTTV